MSRLKRKSAILETARRRLAGLKSISPAPDLGPDLTAAAIEAEVEAYTARQDSYNSKLAAVDDETNQLDDHEQRLNDLSQRLYAAVKGRFGPDSSELEQVGGVRRRDRKQNGRPRRGPKSSS